MAFGGSTRGDYSVAGFSARRRTGGLGRWGEIAGVGSTQVKRTIGTRVANTRFDLCFETNDPACLNLLAAGRRAIDGGWGCAVVIETGTIRVVGFGGAGRGVSARITTLGASASALDLAAGFAGWGLSVTALLKALLARCTRGLGADKKATIISATRGLGSAGFAVAEILATWRGQLGTQSIAAGSTRSCSGAVALQWGRA